MASWRTDLAIERHEDALGTAKSVPGVRHSESSEGGLKISQVVVESSEGAKAVGKPIGRYITFESRELRRHDREHSAAVGKRLSRELAELFPAEGGQLGEALVVGLGNWQATPDALGPQVVQRLLVTRHLQKVVPSDVQRHMRSVAAIAPGVLGLTGIETGDVVRAIVDQVEPRFVIAVDALAARDVERIASTIQIGDTGIQPGSGVGNHRAALNQETLGVPVIAIGVPTVVHAVTIARDTVKRLIAELKGEMQFYEILDELYDKHKEALIAQVLGEFVGDLMVTPKEIDAQIEDLSRLIAGALNTSLQPGIDIGEFGLYS
ncbi:MAG: GPR endopeptidase [Thermaerobacter sp.]|nr:GPR endopeptidase [Thermaerobacter sp.]